MQKYALLLLPAVLLSTFTIKSAESVSETFSPDFYIAHMLTFLQHADEDGTINLSQMLRSYVHDPLPLDPFNITKPRGFLKYNAQFRNLQLYGLKQLTIDRVGINLGEMKLFAQFSVPVLRMEGLYEMTGRAGFFQSTDNGTFWMNVTALTVIGESTLQRSRNGKLEVKNMTMNAKVADIKLHFENLPQFLNAILNQISQGMFEKSKASMLEELRIELTHTLNDQLNTLPEDFMREGSHSIMDDVIQKATEGFHEIGLDPFIIPDKREYFEQDMMLFKVNGEYNLTDGILRGLSTLHRTGGVLVIYENNIVVMEVNLGFTNLTGGFNWSVNVWGVGPSGNATMKIKSISARLIVRQPLVIGRRPIVDWFIVDDIKHIWLDINGLGTLDYVLEIIINLFTNSMKTTISETISKPIQDAIQEQFSNLPALVHV